jgi:hypothetical protein
MCVTDLGVHYATRHTVARYSKSDLCILRSCKDLSPRTADHAAFEIRSAARARGYHSPRKKLAPLVVAAIHSNAQKS